jgi:hypothetical protein
LVNPFKDFHVGKAVIGYHRPGITEELFPEQEGERAQQPPDGVTAAVTTSIAWSWTLHDLRTYGPSVSKQEGGIYFSTD